MKKRMEKNLVTAMAVLAAVTVPVLGVSAEEKAT